MLRKLLTVVLPIALPFLVYWVYVLLARRRARALAEGEPPGWQDAPWTWIIASSVVLLAATLITTRLMSGAEPGAKIEPPRLSDGTVAPARVAE